MTMSRNTKLGSITTIVLTSLLVGYLVYQVNSMYVNMRIAQEEYRTALLRAVNQIYELRWIQSGHRIIFLYQMP